ncbi:serine protease [Deinococcus aetherius]|uniref:Serine protease n=1 Tax=Deinococcus aetherius TaxID=200252 RepID=A0ABM8ACK6_9DEIO|nr:S8 family serine peptidase [Deinococcus aetherius]BDP41451.1 serine protease [Deinococcus aetherius]
MKRLLGPLTAALLLSACSQTPTTVPPRTVDLGARLSLPAVQTFAGTWSVEEASLPAWLTVSPLGGTGDVRLTVTADRARGTRAAADQATLSGQITVVWQHGAESGRTTWTVTADQYTLTGRVVDAAKVQGADVGTRAATTPAPAPEARGVIVKYRSAAAQSVALGRDVPAVRLGEAAQERTRGALARLNVPAAERRDLGGRAVRLETGDVEAALRTLRADPNVEYAVPNAVLRAQGLAAPVVPTDSYAGLQWAYRLLGYGSVWRDMEGGAYTRPVTVAVVDSGVRYDHPDLEGQLYGPGDGALDVLGFRAAGTDVSGYDNGDGDGPDLDPTDPDTPGRTGGSHGTHVSGIIAARWGEIRQACPECSTSGVVGAAYRAPVRVLPVRAIDAQGDAEIADVALAVRYAAGLPVTLEGKAFTNPHPAQVVNLSLGGDVDAETAQPLCDAVADAARAGALVVAAAGNGSGTRPFYPAACEGAVAVGSVTLSGASAPVRASYSSVYPQVALAAPGGVNPQDATFFGGGTLNGQPFPDLIFSTEWDYAKDQPTYLAESGTSQAAPQVSALAALLLSKGVTTGREDTLARLEATATDLGAPGRDDQFGFGMINAAAALGAPAVSDTLGVRVQDARGNAFQPALDPLGRFSAFLPDGTFRVVGGRDRDDNGVYGEANEPRAEGSATLGPGRTSAALGDLTPQP